MAAFLIRTFFFILFGITMEPNELADQGLVLPALVLLATLYTVRFIWMKVYVRMAPMLITIAPRGLITILLYLSLPPGLKIDAIGSGLLFITVICTTVVMALGMARADRT